VWVFLRERSVGRRCGCRLARSPDPLSLFASWHPSRRLRRETASTKALR